ncbi:DUF4123 domain-containing protein [Chromobacterium vaccinii]|uniref:DUF4123 domain-containing protein n=1 Tax=Chromobacterium vaccinii TaxID=1108595 RepID=UPI000E137B64|nr:DUF4123 domain-containing protein [Chromobacterium vaccinii]SUX53563.1 Uncharacterised protein [Chromobacterium vaccinii]
MKPIIDFYPENTPQQLDGVLAAGSQCYALLDHSFLPDQAISRKLNPLLPWRALYEELGGDEDISPLLCQLDAVGSDLWQRQISTLLEISNGQPMLSLWHSPLDFESISQHFASYADVKLLPEKLVYLLRYADTRALPSLIRALDDKQRSQFLGPFERLTYFDRAGGILSITNSPTGQINREALMLDAAQFARMWNDSLPDQILSQLNMPEGHPWHETSPAKRYKQLRQLCRQAEQQGLAESTEIEIFANKRYGRAFPLLAIKITLRKGLAWT